MRLRKVVLLWALAAPAVAWSQTVPTIASGGNLHYVGVGIATWGNGDIGAQINAAYAALPPRGGTIVIVAPTNGACYSFMTPIVAAVPGKYLLLQGGTLASQVTRPSVPVCLNFIQTNSSSAITLDYVLPGETANLSTHGIQNLTLVNNQCETIGGCGSNATGISFGAGNGGAAGATFAGLKVIGFGTGLSVGGSNSRNGNLAFRDCAISYNTTGFLDTDSDGGHISFDACHFHGNATAVSSTASLRISNSWMESNTVLGVNCSSPAACDINSDHFENAEADSTHFLTGNGVFSVLGGDMRDDHTSGNTDWWMNFTGASFFILGTVLTSAGRTAIHVVHNQKAGVAAFQNNAPEILRNLYSNPPPTTGPSLEQAAVPLNFRAALAHVPGATYATETLALNKKQEQELGRSSDNPSNTKTADTVTAPCIPSTNKCGAAGTDLTSSTNPLLGNGVLVVGGTNYTTIQSAIDALPPSGGTVFVSRGTRFGGQPVRIKKPVHLMFDDDAYTYTGAGEAILCSGTNSVIIEGAGQRGSYNLGYLGTSLGIPDSSANGIDINDCPGTVIRNLLITGPSGRGTGAGIVFTSAGGIIENVQVTAMGKSGVEIDGTRGNSNLFRLIAVRVNGNGGSGFDCFGADANAGVWIGTTSSANRGNGYRFGGTLPSCSSNTFAGAHSEGAKGGTGYVFLTGSSGNHGTVYSEPAAPEAIAVSFANGANRSDLLLLNGRVVNDAGTGNQWRFMGDDSNQGSSVHYYWNTPAPIAGSAINVARLLTLQDQKFGTLASEGVFVKAADFHTGYALSERASLNFIYNTNKTGFHTRFYNGCAGDISGCTPVLDLTEAGGVSINGAKALTTTNQSGTGKLCMTASCELERPIISSAVINSRSTGTGVQGGDAKLLTAGVVFGRGNPLCLDADGGATTTGCRAGVLKVARSKPSCTTGNNSYSSCTSTLVWTTPFPDLNYSVTCTGIGPSDPRAGLTVAERSSSNVVVNVVTYGSVSVHFSEIDCTGVSGIEGASSSETALPSNSKNPISAEPIYAIEETHGKTEPN